MDKLLELLKNAAPALATIVGGPVGGLAVSAIADMLGVKDDVNAVVKHLTANPDDIYKLRELDLKQFELEAQDRDSARKAHAEIATSANSSGVEKLVVPFLALGTVGLAFVFIAVLMFIDIPDNQQQMIIYALGFITSSAGQVLSFYFGSSQGSKDKSELMKGLK
jgi:hypothetical protein